VVRQINEEKHIKFIRDINSLPRQAIIERMEWDSPRITRYCQGSSSPSKTTLIAFYKEFGADLKVQAAQLLDKPIDEPKNPEMDQQINDPASDYQLDPHYLLQKLEEKLGKIANDAVAGIAVIKDIKEILQGDAAHRVKKGKGK
jgi:transcriptional regulator with XRE-family HTH domain